MNVTDAVYGSGGGTVDTGTIDYATLFGGVETEVINAITAVIPLAVPILGITLSIAYAKKLFARFSK